MATITGDGDKESIKGLISNIELGGGTDIYPAVEEGAFRPERRVQIEENAVARPMRRVSGRANGRHRILRWGQLDPFRDLGARAKAVD